jgi:hypothetical protein
MTNLSKFKRDLWKFEEIYVRYFHGGGRLCLKCVG